MNHAMTALYRHFDKDGVLLYVGIAINPIARLVDHRKDAHWFRDIRRVEIEYFADRKAALLAETEAIVRERPRFNLDKAPTCSRPATCSRAPVSEVQVAKVIRLRHKEGTPLAHIAILTGLSYRTVHLILERAEQEREYSAAMMEAARKQAKLDDDDVAEIRAKVRAAHEMPAAETTEADA